MGGRHGESEGERRRRSDEETVRQSERKRERGQRQTEKWESRGSKRERETERGEFDLTTSDRIFFYDWSMVSVSVSSEDLRGSWSGVSVFCH